MYECFREILQETLRFEMNFGIVKQIKNMSSFAAGTNVLSSLATNGFVIFFMKV